MRKWTHTGWFWFLINNTPDNGMTPFIPRAEARKAVELGNSVLSKAQETLQILQDFDSKVEENRADFEAIMEETNAIEVLISVLHE